MGDEVPGAGPRHPWWQQRYATARRTTTFAVVAVVLAVALVVAGVTEVLGGRTPFVAAGALFWVPWSVMSVAGAVAQRGEESASGR